MSDIDKVNNPKHYTTTNLECITVMRFIFGDKAVYNFCLCNCFKYLWRNKENKEEDLAKALWYLSYAKKISSENDKRISRILEVFDELLKN